MKRFGRVGLFVFAVAAATAGCQRQSDGDLRTAYERMMAQAERRAVEEEARRPPPPDPAETVIPIDPQHAPVGQPVPIDTAAPSAEEPTPAEPTPRPVAGTVALRDVRVGEHSGFDRVVFEFAAPDLPRHQVGYATPPILECGTGNTIAVGGDRWISVRFEPARAHEFVGEAAHPTVENRNRTMQFGTLRQLVLTCDFEGQVEWVMGVTTQHRYRVLELSEPSRLVIDLLVE